MRGQKCVCRGGGGKAEADTGFLKGRGGGVRATVKGTQHARGSIVVTFFQTELMVEICSKSLVRAMGKVLLIKFSYNTN